MNVFGTWNIGLPIDVAGVLKICYEGCPSKLCSLSLSLWIRNYVWRSKTRIVSETHGKYGNNHWSEFRRIFIIYVRNYDVSSFNICICLHNINASFSFFVFPVWRSYSKWRPFRLMTNFLCRPLCVNLNASIGAWNLHKLYFETLRIRETQFTLKERSKLLISLMCDSRSRA